MNDPKHFCIIEYIKFIDYLEEIGITMEDVITSKSITAKQKIALASDRVAEKGIIDKEFSEYIPNDSEFEKYLLPTVLAENSAIFYVSAPKNTVVKPHSHERGFVRFMLKGEVTFTGLPCGEVTLEAGDWIYIPPNQSYGYIVGNEDYKGNCSYCRI